PQGRQVTHDVLRRLGVLGWPVAHSRSPAMQAAAFAAAGVPVADRPSDIPQLVADRMRTVRV
ncbi:MAG: hypothetical protein ABR591_08460, partial [Candidatus Velthaea sp.]